MNRNSDNPVTSVFDRDRRLFGAVEAMSTNLQALNDIAKRLLLAAVVIGILVLLLGFYVVNRLPVAPAVTNYFTLTPGSRMALTVEAYETAHCFESGESDKFVSTGTPGCAPSPVSNGLLWRPLSKDSQPVDTCAVLRSVRERLGSGHTVFVLQGGHDPRPLAEPTLRRHDSNLNLAVKRALWAENYLRDRLPGRAKESECNGAIDLKPQFLLTARVTSSGGDDVPGHRRVWLYVIKIGETEPALEALR